ncbi:TPM domain-containing protein [Cognatilysobacter bugurensis]|uniref:TPM domain-containing protein n=1 Tax=Cognatilysobacter bugurensis TaxID=543356 RepID=UPI001674F72B|nr:TPM domain-containing protein [Lysobacter bugurensis]
MRTLRHVFPPSVRRRLSDAALARITGAIEAGEATHTGEVCFAVEAALPLNEAWRGVSSRDRAHEVFAQLRVWDTEVNNGVLLYLLLADHAIEIVADRGFEGRVDAAAWQAVCDEVQARLRDGEFEAAIVLGVERLSSIVAIAFPRGPGVVDRNELPNRPTVL